MGRKLDLRTLEQPTLELTLLDDDNTMLRLIVPDVDLIEKLQVVAPKMRKIADSNDGAAIKAIYELFADIISNNMDEITVTAEELRDKYRLKLVHLMFICADYLEFIGEIKNAKN